MTDKVSLPEGIELDVKIYFTSDETGLEACVSLAGYSKLPAIEHFERIDGSKELPMVATDWRRMTRAEIMEFKEASNAKPGEVTVEMDLDTGEQRLLDPYDPSEDT